MTAGPKAGGTWRSLRRLVSAVAAISPRRALTGCAAALASSGLEACGLVLLVPLLQLVGFDTNQGSLGRVGSGVVRLLEAAGVPLTLAAVLVVYVVFATLQSVVQRAHAVLAVDLQQDVIFTLRDRLYRAMARSRWELLVRSRAASFSHVLTDEVDRVGHAAYYLLDLIATLAVALVYLGLAVRISPAMTAVVMACGAVLAGTALGSIAAAHRAGDEYSAAMARVFSVIGEHLGGMKAAKAFGAETRHAAVFNAAARDVDAVGRRMTRVSARARQRIAIGSAVVLAVVVFVSREWLAVPAAAVCLLLFLFARLMPRLTSIPERLQTIAGLLPSLERVAELECRCAAAAEPAADHAQPILWHDRVRFENVTFSYGESADRAALRHLNLEIRAGATTAIVGASGAGKTTAADLLMGLLRPDSGSITIDGRTLSPDRIASWRGQIGYVPQEPFLFHDTIRGNLLWARPGASDEDLQRALIRASAQFVFELPDGLETVVGDRGVCLSGGERQRLALARALIREPALLVLDEPTSSVDSEHEARILDALGSLRRNVTTVIITHRLATIRDADVIYVLDAGELVEAGTWRELIARPAGRLRELALAQGLDAPRTPPLRQAVSA